MSRLGVPISSNKYMIKSVYYKINKKSVKIYIRMYTDKNG